MCFTTCGANRIVSTKGDTGATGATGATGPEGPMGPSGRDGAAGAPWPMYEKSSKGISTSISAGYDYNLSASLPAGSNFFLWGMARVSASDAHVITAYMKVGGVTDASLFYEENTVAGANVKTVTFNMSGAYTTGQPLDIRFESSDPVVNAKLRSIQVFWTLI